MSIAREGSVSFLRNSRAKFVLQLCEPLGEHAELFTAHVARLVIFVFYRVIALKKDPTIPPAILLEKFPRKKTFRALSLHYCDLAWFF